MKHGKPGQLVVWEETCTSPEKKKGGEGGDSIEKGIVIRKTCFSVKEKKES